MAEKSIELKEEIPLPEKYRRLVLFKKSPIFTKPLRKPRASEKVYSLTP